MPFITVWTNEIVLHDKDFSVNVSTSQGDITIDDIQGTAIVLRIPGAVSVEVLNHDQENKVLITQVSFPAQPPPHMSLVAVEQRLRVNLQIMEEVLNEITNEDDHDQLE